MNIDISTTAAVRSTRWAALATVMLFAAACSGGTNASGVLATSSSRGTTTSTSGETTTSTPEETTNSASQSTAPPLGLPADWQTLAISAANAVLQTCAQADSLSPTGCPQSDPLAAQEALTVHWTLLNGLLANAVAVPVDSGDSGAVGQVSVFGRYEMVVSFTTSGQGIRPYLGYLGGIAEATMSWDGTSFQNVQLQGGRFVHVPAGVTVAPFTRPAEATDPAAIAAVQAGFNDCATLPVPSTRPYIPNCPMHTGSEDSATSGQWTINGDPLQGALVSFDTEHGDIAVTGSYSMNFNYVTPPEGFDSQTSWTKNDFGNYTAILAWDGQQLQLLEIGQAS